MGETTYPLPNINGMDKLFHRQTSLGMWLLIYAELFQLHLHQENHMITKGPFY